MRSRGTLFALAVLIAMALLDYRASGDAIMTGTKHPWRTIGRIEKVDLQRNLIVSACTASVIFKNLIISAGHCLATDANYRKTWIYRFSPFLQGNMTLYSVNVLHTIALSHADDPNHDDMGLGRLAEPLGDLTGALEISDYIPTKADGNIFWSVGYGESQKAASAIVLQDKRSHEIQHPRKMLYLEGNMERGMSGGPMLGWFGDRFKLLGINSGLVEQSELGKFKIEGDVDVTVKLATPIVWGLVAKVGPLMATVEENIKIQREKLRGHAWVHVCNLRPEPARVAAAYVDRKDAETTHFGWTRLAVNQCRFLINDQKPPFVIRATPAHGNQRLRLQTIHSDRPRVPRRYDLCVPIDGHYVGNDRPCANQHAGFEYQSGEDVGIPAGDSNTVFVNIVDEDRANSMDDVPRGPGASDKPSRAPRPAREF